MHMLVRGEQGVVAHRHVSANFEMKGSGNPISPPAPAPVSEQKPVEVDRKLADAQKDNVSRLVRRGIASMIEHLRRGAVPAPQFAGAEELGLIRALQDLQQQWSRILPASDMEVTDAILYLEERPEIAAVLDIARIDTLQPYFVPDFGCRSDRACYLSKTDSAAERLAKGIASAGSAPADGVSIRTEARMLQLLVLLDLEANIRTEA